MARHDMAVANTTRHALVWQILLLSILAAGCSSEPDWTPSLDEPDGNLLEYRAPGMRHVPVGFRSEVHPLLGNCGEVRVEAFWMPTPCTTIYPPDYPLEASAGLPSRYSTHKSPFPLSSYAPFQSLKSAQSFRDYSARHFSAFMPAGTSLPEVGAAWSIDSPRAAEFLTQFHPAVSLHLNSTGRLPGPNGGFALLRANSPTHVEIVFRLHAEFEPETANGVRLFFTPGEFFGILRINKKKRAIENFKFGIPSESALNTMLTAELPTEALIDLVHIDCMELVAADGFTDEVSWTKEIAMTEARRRLKRLFYDSMEIRWVPPDQATDLAAQTGRPIMAVVLWGALDDQSC